MRIGGGLWAWSSACGSSVEGGVVEGGKGRRGALPLHDRLNMRLVTADNFAPYGRR
jgi:hypothetical protein